MRQSFQNNIKGYENVYIKTELIGGETSADYSVDTWLNIFDDRELCERVYNLLKQNTYEYGNDGSYNQKRYYRK